MTRKKSMITMYSNVRGIEVCITKTVFCLRNAWTTTIVRNTIIMAQEKEEIGFTLDMWFCFILDGKRRDLQSARLVWCWLDASQHETHQTSTWYIRQQVDVCLHKISLWPGISVVHVCYAYISLWLDFSLINLGKLGKCRPQQFIATLISSLVL